MILHWLVLAALLPVSLSQSSGSFVSDSPISRHYKLGESLTYHMTASNQGRTGTIRYEADATGKVKKNAEGHFVEEFHWSGLVFNGQALPLPASVADFRQELSLDPALSPTAPDFTHVNPLLIGPCADLLTSYADLWLAIKQSTLVRSGDRVYVKHGTPNSWADGNQTVFGQDSIDFDILLSELNRQEGTAKLVVRHVPPRQPQVQLPAKWMEAAVSNTPNNWVEVTRSTDGKYLAEVGKETFDVEMIVSLADGRMISATMDNPVSVSARECSDSALTNCGELKNYQIRRQIDLRLVR